MSKVLKLLVVIAMFCVPAAADLMGTNMAGCMDPAVFALCPGTNYFMNNTTATVGAGVEFTAWLGNGETADFTGNTLTLTYGPGYYWINDMEFTFYVTTPGVAITSATLTSSNFPAGITTTVAGGILRIIVGNHVNYENLEVATFDIGVRDGRVPEPATILLLGSGLAMARALRRKKQA